MELEPLMQEEQNALLAVLLPDVGDDTMDEFEAESYCLMSKSAIENVPSSEDDDHELEFHSFEDDGTSSLINSGILLPTTSPSPAPVVTLDAAADANKDENHRFTDYTTLEHKLDILIADLASLGLPNAHNERLQRELDVQTRLLTTERAGAAKLEADLQEARATVSALHALDGKFAVLLADKCELADARAVASQLTEEKHLLEEKVAALDERTRLLETELETAQRRLAEEKCSLEEKLVTMNEHARILEASLEGTRAQNAGLTAEMRKLRLGEQEREAALDVEQMKARGALTLAGKRDEKLRELGERITTLGITNKNLITEVANLKTELHEARTDAARDKETIRQRDEHIERITRQLDSESAALKASEAGLKERDARITELNRFVNLEKTQAITRDMTLKTLGTVYTREQEAIQDLRHREAEQNTEAARLRADLERTRVSLSQLKQAKSTEVARLRADLESAKASLSQSEQAKSTVNVKLGSLERKYARMKQEKETVTRSMESERAKWCRDLEEQQRDADEKHNQEVVSLREQVTALEATRDELKTANDQQKRKIRGLKQSLRSLEDQQGFSRGK